MFPRIVVLLLCSAGLCLVQNTFGQREVKLGEGVSFAIPLNWQVTVERHDAPPTTASSQPALIFLARAPATGGSMGDPFRRMPTASLSISKWAVAAPAKPFDSATKPVELDEALWLRQMLAVEGFNITESWATGKTEGDTQALAVSYACTAPGDTPFVVEAALWQSHGEVVVAQLRHSSAPGELRGSLRETIDALKSSFRWRDQPTLAFASGYALPDGRPSMAGNAPPGVPRTALTARDMPFGPNGGAGSVMNGGPTAVVPFPSPSPTVGYVPDKQASDLVRATSGSIVIVEGKDKSGSGFVCNLGGQKWMITNAHVLSGNAGVNLSLLDRSVIQVGAAGAAVGHDMVRFAVTSANTPALEVLDNMQANLSVGDEVIVLGNAEGARVVNPIVGHLVGIGPDLVEVDAEFLPGNSGSPILQKRTGKVIGIATYAIERQLETLADGSKQKKIRRFGYRLDSVRAWQPVNWTEFNAEAAGVQRAEALTLDLARLWKDIADDGHVTQGAQLNSAVRKAVDDYVGVTRSHSRASSADILAAKQSFLSTMRSISKADLVQLRPKLVYDYFQRKADNEQEVRDEFYKVFDQLLKMQTEERIRSN